MKAFILITLMSVLLTTSTVKGLYEHQAGKYDWSIKNAGEIDTVLMTAQKIYFTLVNDDYSIGGLSATDGALLYLTKEKHKILDKKGLKSETVMYNEKQSSLSIFRLHLGDFIQNHPFITSSPILATAFLENDNGIFVLTEKELIYEANQGTRREKNILQSARANEVFWLLFSRKDFIYIGRSDKAAKKTCLGRLSAPFSENTLTEKCFQTKSDLDVKKSFINPEEFFMYEESIENTHVIFLNQFVYRQIESPTNYKIIASKHLENSSIRVFEERDNYHFFELVFETSNYRKLYTVKKPQGVKFQFSFVKGVNSVSRGIVIVSTTNAEFKVKLLNLENNDIKDLFSKTLDRDVGNARKIWVGSDRNPDELAILAQTESLNTIYYSKKTNSILWNREDSLSSIVDSHFVNYEDIKELHINHYYESLEKYGTHNVNQVVQNFFFRIKSESEEFISYLKSLHVKFSTLFNRLTDFQNIKANLQILNQGLDDESYDINYALRKMIIAHSKYNTIFGIDSKRGELIWRVYLKESQQVIKGIYTLESKVEDVISHTVVIVLYSEVDRQLKFLTINPLTGKLLSERVDVKENIRVKKIVKIPATKDILNEALLIIDEKYGIHLYPNHLWEQYEQKLNKLSFYILDEETKVITGYKYNKHSSVQAWNKTLSSNEEVIAIKSLSSSDPNALASSLNGVRITIPEDKKVLYMNIDFNNFAVLTKISKPGLNSPKTLNLYIINGIYGRVLFNQYVADVNFEYPINMVYDDNAVLVTYFNKKSLGFELWVIESYLEKMETSIFPILESFYFQTESYSGVNYANLNLDCRFLEQKYGIAPGVKYFTTFKSKYGLTRKNLLIITQKNQLLMLDRSLTSTRRSIRIDNKPLLESSSSLESIELPPYKYNIPVNPMNYLSYYLSFNDLRKVDISPTNLESTSLIFAYGRDLFFTRLAPENSFDKLNEDFNYFYLIATVITIIVVTLVMRHLTKKARVNEIFNR